MKKSMKLVLIVLLTAVLIVGCTSKPNDDTGGNGNTDEKTFNIGIIQILEHDALDASRKGFIDALAAGGYVEGKNVKFDYQNGQGNRDTLTTIAQKFVNDKKDLVLAVATQSAQSMAQQTDTIPIVVTAVTDLVDAGLVESNEKPGRNVTGTTDMNPIKEQLSLIKELDPTVKVVGIIYNTGESNSEIQVEIAQSYADELGFSFELAGISNSSEVKQAADSLATKVDAFYIPTDNTVVASIDSILIVAEALKKPVIAGESDTVRNGAIMTYGLDYYKLGFQTGEMAIKILKGEAKPASMPVESQRDMTLTINTAAAAKMGATVPQALLDRADEIITE